MAKEVAHSRLREVRPKGSPSTAGHPPADLPWRRQGVYTPEADSIGKPTGVSTILRNQFVLLLLEIHLKFQISRQESFFVNVKESAGNMVFSLKAKPWYQVHKVRLISRLQPLVTHSGDQES